jgi:DNA-binding response OmpR family regulator
MPCVLVVEDDDAVRLLIEAALQARDVETCAAATDAEAYELLDRNAAGFSILIADINLGRGTTGYDVARRARRLNPRLAVIYISGQSVHLDRFGVGGAMMFPKPFDVDELVDRILALGRR